MKPRLRLSDPRRPAALSRGILVNRSRSDPDTSCEACYTMCSLPASCRPRAPLRRFSDEHAYSSIGGGARVFEGRAAERRPLRIGLACRLALNSLVTWLFLFRSQFSMMAIASAALFGNGVTSLSCCGRQLPGRGGNFQSPRFAQTQAERDLSLYRRSPMSSWT